MPQFLVELFEALAATPFAAFFRGSTTAYATLNAAHIFSFGVVIGSIAALDLKLLGFFAQPRFARWRSRFRELRPPASSLLS